ncbi:glycosyltransferase family 2 protein [Deltaproteobacteria bacterium IMCC39524]|nr:glycosyltransferase family 2 protein [Deltaproteobacteria bacterium IMCC39524]
MNSQLSIITPVYNGARFIEFCIKNVIEQDCPVAEHIIVDGGSTDGTVEIIKRYVAEFPHIRWVSDKDRGQSDAMNKGIAMSKGSIISFLNVDDFYEPGVLVVIPELFKNLPVPSLLVGDCNVLNDSGVVEEVNKPKKLKITDLLMGWDINPFPTNPSQYFYHKSLHEIIGPYDINEHYSLDIDFVARAVQSANVHYVDKVFGNYRKIAGTKTTNDIISGENYPRFLSVLEKYRKGLTLSQKLQVAVMRRVIKLHDLKRRFFLIGCHIV